MCRLYSFKPEAVACDLHPDYASTHWAENSGLPLIRVQHHQAHVAACAAENGVQGAYLGVSWDGTGYGIDGAIWGGEFFRVENQHVEGNQYERVAHLRSFGLPGGDAAVREGWRSASSLLFEVFGPETALPDLRRQQPGKPRLDGTKVRYMLQHGINVVPTTSVGRLFDAVACITGIARQNRFEGQAAMLLENEIGSLVTGEAYALAGGDWGPLISAVVADKADGVAVPLIAARFHNALVEWILEVAAAAKLKQMVLSGGVFQNRYLTERAARCLGVTRLCCFHAPAGSAQRWGDCAGAGGDEQVVAPPSLRLRSGQAPAAVASAACARCLLLSGCVGETPPRQPAGRRRYQDRGGHNMCLAVPGRVVEIIDGGDVAFRVGKVDFGGIRKEINLAYVPEAEIGKYVLVHVGFAISVIDEDEAKRVFQYLEELGALKEELGEIPQ